MLKIVYPICCGMDVHKSFVVACIASTNMMGVTTYESKRFSTFTGDLQQCRKWLEERGCKDVCMESTGKYWIPVYNYLEADIEVCLTHPKYVKAIKGKKTDKKDSKWIADLYKFDLVRCSFIPPKDFRQLREISRYRFKLVCMKTSEKNRVQNCMTVSNIALANYVSDPFSKTATDIMSYLLQHTSDDICEKDIQKMIRKNSKATADELFASIKGYTIEADQAKKLELARNHLEYLDGMIKSTETELYIRIKPYWDYVEFVSTMPGMTQLSSTIVLAETGVNMAIFDDSGHLCSWCGLTPRSNESAGKKYSSKIMKAGAYLKPMMAAIASKKQPYFAIKYRRIKKRRGHKVSTQ